MARIEIKDLAVDETLDANALERVRGGIIIINNLPTGLNFVKIDRGGSVGVKIDFNIGGAVDAFLKH